ncbi:hypothetical protein N1851_021819 [Merluccius polli]|uniref:Uncharacterized protein n=1 Tax=Merluccius polli TaxID=89951 RepID=A0AA47MIZ3_MERPO|nr:hypothetical protein N1851_021819 [Merluccius polli]
MSSVGTGPDAQNNLYWKLLSCSRPHATAMEGSWTWTGSLALYTPGVGCRRESSSILQQSVLCETEGLKQCTFLKEQDMQMLVLITYRNVCFLMLLQVQFVEVAETDCEDLRMWRPAIINHLYWTAASTPIGDPYLMEAKWQSIVNHVQDIHNHNTPAFTSCSHPPLEGETRDKEWLEPGTESIAAFVKECPQVIPTASDLITGSISLCVAPKHTGFSFLGM